MWPIWFRSEISSGKDFEILWKFVIFQVFISTVLSNLHSTDVIPPLYWCYPPLYWRYPPLYWISSTVLMLSPHSTDVIPCMYWCYPPTVLNHLHSTEAIPHSTEAIPPLYWTTSTVQKLPPTVLKLSPHSTDVIPPMYWTTSNVLNNLHSTEPTLCGFL